MVDLELSAAGEVDADELFQAYSVVVADLDGFPHAPPLRRGDFEDYWFAHSDVVIVGRVGGRLVGAYYLKPNFVGRAAHIANAGYFVSRPYRGRGVGRAMLLDSFSRGRSLGFDALQFNLVFESNPARRLYEELGFRQIGRIPRAVDGEDALIYWRSLEEEC